MSLASMGSIKPEEINPYSKTNRNHRRRKKKPEEMTDYERSYEAEMRALETAGMRRDLQRQGHRLGRR